MEASNHWLKFPYYELSLILLKQGFVTISKCLANIMAIKSQVIWYTKLPLEASVDDGSDMPTSFLWIYLTLVAVNNLSYKENSNATFLFYFWDFEIVITTFLPSFCFLQSPSYTIHAFLQIHCFSFTHCYCLHIYTYKHIFWNITYSVYMMLIDICFQDRQFFTEKKSPVVFLSGEDYLFFSAASFTHLLKGLV